MVTKEKALSTKPNIQTVSTFPIEGISWETLKDKVNQMNAENYALTHPKG